MDFLKIGLSAVIIFVSCKERDKSSHKDIDIRSSSQSEATDFDLKDSDADQKIEQILGGAEPLAKAMDDAIVGSFGGDDAAAAARFQAAKDAGLMEDGTLDPRQYMARNKDAIDRIHKNFETTKMELRTKLLNNRSLLQETASFVDRMLGRDDPFYVEVESTQQILIKYRDAMRKLIGDTSYYNQEIFKIGQLYDKKINTTYDKIYDSVARITEYSISDAFEQSIKMMLRMMPVTVPQNCLAMKRYKSATTSPDFAVSESMIGKITDSAMIKNALLDVVGLGDDFSMFTPSLPASMCEAFANEKQGLALDGDPSAGLNLNVDDLEYLIFTHMPFIKFVGVQFAIRGFVPAGGSQIDLAGGIRYGTPLDGSHFPCLETFASARVGFGSQALRGLSTVVSRKTLNPLKLTQFVKRKIVVALGFKSLKLPPPLIWTQKNSKGEYPNWYEYPIVSFSLMSSGGSVNVTRRWIDIIRSWFSKHAGWNGTMTNAIDWTRDLEINIHPTTQTLYIKILGGGKTKTSVRGVSEEKLMNTIPGFGVTAGAEVLLTSTCSKRRQAMAEKLEEK